VLESPSTPDQPGNRAGATLAELRDWLRVSTTVGAALTISALYLIATGTAQHQRDGLRIAGFVGIGLLTVVIVVRRWPRAIGMLLGDSGEATAVRATSHPQLTLFIASFTALFLELALIRYTGSQLRVFAFFKNVPLIAAYLGLGVGCAIGAGRPRHAASPILWFVPLAAALACGPFVFAGAIGRAAAAASSEQILGDVVIRSSSWIGALLGQVSIGALCFVTLLAIASLFVPLGRLLGESFERLPRLPAYTVNILGGLTGTVVFMLLSALWMPPGSWFLVGLVPLLWWLDRPRDAIMGAALILMSVLAVSPSVGTTVWSPYQKLVGQPVIVPPIAGAPPVAAYRVDISDVFYQVAMDLRPSAVGRAGTNPLPHYDAALRALSRPIRRVLIVGSGTGNDVAAALRAGAEAVDAVDIDPAIIALGRQHHPEHPYDDLRVHVIVDDARAMFRRMAPGVYDAVFFGLLDSHTQLGMSSVRLDNYVFTRESFGEARRLLRPGGRIVVTAATFRDWFRQRFVDILTATCDTPVETHDVPKTTWVTYECQIANPQSRGPAATISAALPTDDWPFLYLPTRAIPLAYGVVLVVLAWGSALVIRANGLSPQRVTAEHAHMFFLGAAFLLMEVYAVNRLALLFGTTWIVSAVAIVIVLTLIVAANLTLTLRAAPPYAIAYIGLGASLLVSYALNPEAALGRGLGVSTLYGFVALFPVYFAGLVFARSFVRSS
jgi:SAM-dependent methyltransferase